MNARTKTLEQRLTAFVDRLVEAGMCREHAELAMHEMFDEIDEIFRQADQIRSELLDEFIRANVIDPVLRAHRKLDS